MQQNPVSKNKNKSDTKVMGILVNNRQSEHERQKAGTTFSSPLSKVDPSSILHAAQCL